MTRVATTRCAGRFACMFSLLLGEIVFLSMQFDTAALDAQGGWLSWLGSLSPQILRIGVASVAAIVVLGGPGLYAAFAVVCHRNQDVPGARCFLCLHLIALACFVGTTSIVFDHRGPITMSEMAWLAGSLVSGIMAATSWLLATMSAADWMFILHSGRGGFIVGGLVGIAAWASGTATSELWRPLSRATLAVVGTFLSSIESDITLVPQELIVGSSAYTVMIKPECSGCEGIGLILVFIGTFLWLWRHELRFPRALILLPLGAMTIWLANASRITATVLIGTHWSSEVAAGGFHSQAGWLAMNAIALGVVALARSSAWLRLESQIDMERAYNPSVSYLLPFLAATAASMATTAFSSDGGSTLYPVRPLAALLALWWCRREYAYPTWSWSGLPVALGGIVAVAWIALTQSPSADARSLAEFAPALSGGWLVAWWAARIIGYVAVAPVVEELAFRGFLTRRLISADFDKQPLGRFTWLSFLGSSLAFGAVHGSLWLPGMLAGALFALALYRRGRLVDAVVAHGVANAALALYAASTQHWEVFG